MDLAGYEFREVSRVEAELDSDGLVWSYRAHDRYDNRAGHPMLKFGEGPFVRLILSPLPAQPGVYAVTSGGAVKYVGKATTSISARWSSTNYGMIHPRNCFRGGQATNVRINHFIHNALARHEDIRLWLHLTTEPSDIEERIIRAVQPPWNRRGLGNQPPRGDVAL